MATATFLLAVGFMAATYLFFFVLLHATHDSNEPPAIETSIPCEKPLLGFITGMQKYCVHLNPVIATATKTLTIYVVHRDEYNLPIYTLRLPGQRIYIVNDVKLIPPLQRRIKTIAFAPIEVQVAAAVMGVGPKGIAIIGSNNVLDDDSYLSTFVPSTQPALAPGTGLEAINSAAVIDMANSLVALGAQGPATLFPWVRREILRATTESIYGPMNPFRDSILETAWYTFEPHIMVHMLKACPSVLVSESLHAREQLLIPAFERYFANGEQLQGSLLVQCRYKHNHHHGLRGRDVAATEIGQMVASLTNSVVGAFWMIYYVFSDPIVMNECREEVRSLVRTDKSGHSIVDLSEIRSSCPILLSTWQEVLHYVHIGISARVVTKDTMLDTKYLLEKGAAVMTVAPAQHTDKSTREPTVNTFDHERFLRRPGTKPPNPTAFRSFGGGKILCPGRHFVSTEVMAFPALLLLRFDLKPIAKGKIPAIEWPGIGKNLPMASSIPTPKDEIRVEFEPRDRCNWLVRFSSSSKGVDIGAEDVK